MEGAAVIIVGDCAQVMRDMPEQLVDAIVCDPPYGLEFMGKDWDKFGRNAPPSFTHSMQLPRPGGLTRTGMIAFQHWAETWAIEALRVLKPGGHLLAFGGTRTYHRLASGLEDAGFEIRDTIAWMYGSGFPKSLNIGDGRGTALKPAFEPVVVARKPLTGTVARNVREHGTGALNIDGCRIATTDALGGGAETETRPDQKGHDGWTRPWMENEKTQAAHAARVRGNVAHAETLGRWPANVVLGHHDDCADDACHPGCPVRLLDEQTGVLTSGKEPAGGFRRNAPERREGIYGGGKGLWKDEQDAGSLFGDSGGASRFFYQAKASRAERNAGLDGFDAETADATPFNPTRPICNVCGCGTLIPGPGKRLSCGHDDYRFVASVGGKSRLKDPARNNHPTVKPVSLMRWLVRLVTPPGGHILDPFLGSGTTGIAAHLERFLFTGIEQDPDYARIAEARIGWWHEHGEAALRIVAERDRAEQTRQQIRAAGQLSLTDDLH